MQLELESLCELTEAGADGEELLNLYVRGTLCQSLAAPMKKIGVRPYALFYKLLIINVRHVVHAVAVQSEAELFVLSFDEELDVLTDTGRQKCVELG